MNSIFKDALVSTLFALSVLAFTKFILNVNLKALNTFDLLSYKINYTDLYFSNFYENHQRDNDIVLVNIEDADRKGIAQIIEDLNRYQPAVIGIDISFRGTKDSLQDDQLIAAIANAKNVIFPHFENPLLDSLKRYKPDLYFGSNEFLADENGLLKFVHFPSKPKSALFSQLVAEKFNESQVQGSLDKEINYYGTYQNFRRYSYKDLMISEDSLLVRDKIVLIGYAGPSWEHKGYSEDKYFTPLDFSHNLLQRPVSSGLVIHANIIRNIIKNNFIKISPRYLDYLLLFVFLYILNLFYLKNFKRLSIAFYLKCRLFQLMFTGVLAYGMFILFHFTRMKFGLAEWILVIIASFELSMIFVYSMNFFGNKFGLKSYIHTKLNP